MNDKFKDFPICINCKYFMEEKTGPQMVKLNCGLTMINPVNGEYEPRRNRQAASYRKEGNPCGPSGLFFKPKPGKQVEPEPMPVVVEFKKESTAKVVKVEVPEIMHGEDKARITKDNPALSVDGDLHLELTPAIVPEIIEEPKKRRRRSK